MEVKQWSRGNFLGKASNKQQRWRGRLVDVVGLRMWYGETVDVALYKPCFLNRYIDDVSISPSHWIGRGAWYWVCCIVVSWGQSQMKVQSLRLVTVNWHRYGKSTTYVIISFGTSTYLLNITMFFTGTSSRNWPYVSSIFHGHLKFPEGRRFQTKPMAFFHLHLVGEIRLADRLPCGLLGSLCDVLRLLAPMEKSWKYKKSCKTHEIFQL